MASAAWPTLQQHRVQGSQNKIQTLTAAQQQQMTQAQLTYAQKVKGQQQQQQQQRQLPNSSQSQQQPQFRMVPTQTILQPQTSNINMSNMANMAASALSNYAYPYNYTNLQPQSQQQQQQQQSPYQHHHPHHQQHQQHQHRSHPPQQRSSQFGQRDFFDRRVQNNVNSAVSQYYNSNANKRRSNRAYPHDHGQKSTYSSSINKTNGNRPKRSKPTDVQLKTYEAAVDRDVLCWIYENQGKCRYGEKCQWLHLDRETGKYVPTVYIMNSLKENDTDNEKDHKIHQINAKSDVVDDDDEKNENENEAETQTETQTETDIDNANENEVELQKKFQLLMEKTIKRNLEKKEKEKDDEKEKENDNDNDNETEKETEKEKEKDTHKDEEKEKEKAKQKEKDTEKARGYGSYGTTFDRHNVCWEFNTFVGCRKGSKCKWAHQYLIKETSHPYTGEKLNGMAVRKFRLSHNI